MKQTLSTHGIGASEIAAVAGLHPYASPWDIWLRKTGQAPDVDESPEMEWGLRLEPAIRQKYADVTGAPLYIPSASLFSPDAPWARATPDAIALESAEPLAPWLHIMQAKAVGYWPGKDWDDGPPAYVLLQEQWEMFVTGLPRADVAALVGLSDFRVYTVHRDDTMIADLLDIGAAFWRRVETRTPPKIDASEACRDHFTRRLVKAPCVELQADAALNAIVGEWYEARRALKRAEEDVERCRNTVLSALVDAHADRLISTYGVAKLARTSAKTHHTTDWRLVAQLAATAPCTPERFSELVAANTTTSTSEASVSLREPYHWSKESK